MQLYPQSSLQVEDSTDMLQPCPLDELLFLDHYPSCIQSLPVKVRKLKKEPTCNFPTSTYSKVMSKTSTFTRLSKILRLGTYLMVLLKRYWAVDAANHSCNRISSSISHCLPAAFIGSFQKLKPTAVKTVQFQEFQSSPTSPMSSNVQPILPIKESSKKRNNLSESSWEQANTDVRSDPIPAFRATPTFLEILEAATKGIPSSVTSSTTVAHKRPRGRPDSVPGAMSRSTILNMNEIEFNRITTSNPAVVRYLDDIYDQRNVPPSFMDDSSTFADEDTANNEDGIKKGRGRPRKYTAITMEDSPIQSSTVTNGIAESVYTSSPSRSPPLQPNSFKRSKARKSLISNSSGDEYSSDGDEEIKVRKRVVKALPKAKPRRRDDATETDNKDSGVSTERSSYEKVGAMGGSDDFDPPNLQRYYRTELLSSAEEYALGIKVQFVMKCEQVHEGLFLQSDQTPTIVEWANACGFKEHDPVMCAPDFVESDIELMIRPSKSDAIDDDMDPSMFIGNGLVNASGVGRGKGRVKKPPPLELKDYFDDTSIKFSEYSDDSSDDDIDFPIHDSQKMKPKIRPINRGSPRDFVNMMMAGREAKQRMVQCNMRLVVSIAKRYRHVGVNIADLVQEGSIGLTRAAEKFDPRKGFKFSTYASWYVLRC